MFLLQGRSGLVAMVLVATVFVAMYTPRAKRLPVVAAVVFTGAVLLASSPLVRDRLLLGYSEIVNYQPFEKTSLGARIDMWRFALDRTLEHPLLGNGAGTYHQMASEHFGHCIWVCTHPHSQYLYFGVEYGIPALMAFLWLLWRIRLTAKLSTQAERSILYAFLAIVAVDSLFNVPLWWRGQSYFTYAMLGLLIASNFQSPKDSRHRF
jgi:O-antigen ligase